MKKDSRYQKVTEMVKVKMRSLDIVVPRRYSMLFSDAAKEMEIDLGPEEVMTDKQVGDKVVSHVRQLSDSAIKAVDAIEAEDRLRLRQVLEETKALQEEIEELRSAVYEDALTKVFNRRWLGEHYLRGEDERLVEEGLLVMIDLNDFKYINDTFGHVVGDRVLFFIASELKRSGGHVVRYGGDEFFVLFDESFTKKSAWSIMHDIRESIIKRMLNADGERFRTSFSYGIAEFVSGNSLRSVVQLADEEMYRDKVKIKARLQKNR